MTTERLVTSFLIAGMALGALWGLAPTRALAEEATLAAGEDMIIEEVTVTARKREETLQDITAAVSVVDSERLRSNIINDVRDLQNIVPTLNIGEVVGILKISMRGLGNSTNTRSEDSDVVLHEDGVVVSRMEAQAMTFFDLDRIEVLRGPQGTLYGRNSTGGTINLVTNKPTEELEAYVNLTVGNYDFFKTEAAVSGPLSDNILGRVAVQSISRSGFGVNIGSGNDIDDEHRWAARGHLMFQLADNADFLLTGEYAHQDDASGFFTFMGPLNPNVPPIGTGGFSDPDSRDGASSFDPQLERETYSITGTLNWDLNEQFTLRNIINYRNLDFFLGQDLDTSTVVNPVAVGIPLDDDQFSNELQLVYNGDRLNGLAGLFYFNETFGGATNIGITPVMGTYYVLLGESETDAWAPFWNATYQLNDAWALRAGGRWNNEDRRITNDAIFNGNRITTDNDISDDQRDLEKYTGEYGVDFDIADGHLVYYTYAQGFRSGAALIFQSTSPIIDPTTVDANEIGYKFQSRERRFSANFAIYHNDIEDLQRTQATINEAGLLITRVSNVNKMETQGFEVDLWWLPTERFRLSAAAAYVDGEFKDFVTDDPLVPGIDEVQVAGNSPRLTPDWKANVHGEYDFDLGSSAVLTAAADLTYVGDQYFDEFNRSPFEEDGYTLFDANLTYRPPSGTWSVALWGKNLTDEKQFADTTFSAFGGVTSKHFINPRTFGVTAAFEF
jgi:iron complex outermembrane receptor protein